MDASLLLRKRFQEYGGNQFVQTGVGVVVKALAERRQLRQDFVPGILLLGTGAESNCARIGINRSLAEVSNSIEHGLLFGRGFLATIFLVVLGRELRELAFENCSAKSMVC